MADWLKNTLADLIHAYRAEENLYNQKHKLYYNKKARTLSMKRILEGVQKSRPETTPVEISKKIQTLRTQFGQEVSKIEKTRAELGDELTYKPKIWWFPQLQWIGDYMKTRTDSTPLSVKAKTPVKPDDESVLYEFDVEDGDTLLNETENELHQTQYTQIEISEEDQEVQEPPAKRKVFAAKTPIRSQLQSKQDKSGVRTIEYTLIEDTPQASTSKTADETNFIAIDDDNVVSTNTEKFKRRSKTFGKYVSALLFEITDDEIFFDLQRNITNAIHDATKKQLVQRKS